MGSILYDSRRQGIPGLTKDGKVAVVELGEAFGMQATLAAYPRYLVFASANCHSGPNLVPKHLAVLIMSGDAGDGFVVCKSVPTVVNVLNNNCTMIYGAEGAIPTATGPGNTTQNPSVCPFIEGWPIPPYCAVYLEWQLDADDPDPDCFVALEDVTISTTEPLPSPGQIGPNP